MRSLTLAPIFLLALHFLGVLTSSSKANASFFCDQVHSTNRLPLVGATYFSLMQKNSLISQLAPTLPRGGTCGAVCIGNLFYAGQIAVHRTEVRISSAENLVFHSIQMAKKEGQDIPIHGMGPLLQYELVQKLARQLEIPLHLEMKMAETYTKALEKTELRWNSNAAISRLDSRQSEILKKLFFLKDNELALVAMNARSHRSSLHAFVLLYYDPITHWAYLSDPVEPNKPIKARLFLRRTKNHPVEIQFVFDGVLGTPYRDIGFVEDVLKLSFIEDPTETENQNPSEAYIRALNEKP